MSRLRVFRQTGWFIAGLMTGLPATAAVSHSLALAASLDAQGYSVNDIIHILMAEGGQA